MQREDKRFDVILSGQITSDDLFFSGGEAKYAVPGGCCIWAAIGAAFWSEQVAVFSRSGTRTVFSDAPFSAFGIDLSHVRHFPDRVGICDYLRYDGVMNKSERGLNEGSTPIPDMTPCYSDAPPAFFAQTRGFMISCAMFDRVKAYVENIPGDVVLGLDTALRWRWPEEDHRDEWLQVLAGIDCLLLSELELTDYYDIEPFANPVDYVPLLREMCSGKTQVFCLKIGPAGVLVYVKAEDAAYLLPSAATKVVDSTGCGDSFCGGFLVNYARDKDWFTAAAKGTVSSSIIIEHTGSDFFRGFPKEEAHRRLAAYLAKTDKEACRIC